MKQRLDVCPFRVVTQKTKDSTVQFFDRCLREKCPAFNRREVAYDNFEEKCLMFDEKGVIR